MTTSMEQHEYAEMNVEPAHHEHPSNMFYVRVFIVLVIFTAIEVALSYMKMNERLNVVLLLVFAALKFVTVVAYFMHLKFDHPWFRRLFVAGFVLAVFCYVTYLATLQTFG